MVSVPIQQEEYNGPRLVTFEDESQWLEIRKGGVGGSDVAAILGMSKWRTPLQVYYEKIGEVAGVVENEAMRWGKKLEPLVRQEYSDYTGRTVFQPKGVLQHPEFPFMLASLDGYTSDGRVIEVKTTRRGEEWGDEDTDEIPVEYLLQCQHYMVVTGMELADLAVLIGGNDFRVYEIPSDKELHEMLVEKESAFWEQVLKEEPPKPLTEADYKQLYMKVRGGTVTATQELVSVVSNMKTIKTQIKDLKSQEEVLKAQVMSFMQDQDVLLDTEGNPLVTWKQGKPSSVFDIERFHNEHPLLYTKYRVETPGVRRFLVK